MPSGLSVGKTADVYLERIDICSYFHLASYYRDGPAVREPSDWSSGVISDGPLLGDEAKQPVAAKYWHNAGATVCASRNRQVVLTRLVRVAINFRLGVIFITGRANALEVEVARIREKRGYGAGRPLQASWTRRPCLVPIELRPARRTFARAALYLELTRALIIAPVDFPGVRHT